MTSAAKHTAGPAQLDGQYVTNASGATIADCGKSSLIYTAEKVANATFIADAFNVAHETGLTPRQLAEQRNELLAELKQLRLAYVDLLETGRDRILALGGQCDPVDAMEAGSPPLRSARTVIVKAEGAKPFYGAECPSYPNCSGGCGCGCTHEIEAAEATAGGVA